MFGLLLESLCRNPDGIVRAFRFCVHMSWESYGCWGYLGNHVGAGYMIWYDIVSYDIISIWYIHHVISYDIISYILHIILYQMILYQYDIYIMLYHMILYQYDIISYILHIILYHMILYQYDIISYDIVSIWYDIIWYYINMILGNHFGLWVENHRIRGVGFLKICALALSVGVWTAERCPSTVGGRSSPGNIIWGGLVYVVIRFIAFKVWNWFSRLWE